MRDLVEYVAQSLVSQPDLVRVTEVEDNGVLVIQLQVAPEDMGKVIGRQGRIANALRSLLKVASMRQSRRCVLEIV
ncbi:MAG TPA: KH domain-containing protein [Chloroflexota bacterium]|nr:KH domain-containing protein [Chloroflexota bacterium]